MTDGPAGRPGGHGKESWMSLDATTSPADRATELLRAMTVEEKARQVTGLMPLGLLGVHGLVEPVDVDAAVTVRLTVRNAGERAGAEVVQLYFADEATGVTRPAQELVGFTRVSLAAGAAATVEFRVAMSQLGYVGLDGRFLLEPGPIQVLAGSSSDDIRLRGSFEVVGDPVVLEGRRSYLSSVTVGDASPVLAASPALATALASSPTTPGK